MTTSTIIFLALAVLCWGAGAVFDKLTLKHLTPDTAFIGRTFFMILLFIPLLFFGFSKTYNEMIAASKYSWLYLAAAVIVTMGGVFFYLKAMSVAEASKIVPLSSTYPLVTLVLAVFFLNENLNAAKLFGTLLISAGIYFVTK